jgi:hypothetical protein
MKFPFSRVINSPLRLPSAKNRANNVVTTYNHGENLSTTIKETPAATRKTKPEAMIMTSIKTKCFNFLE